MDCTIQNNREINKTTVGDSMDTITKKIQMNILNIEKVNYPIQKNIREHILSIPRVEQDPCAGDSNKIYLDGFLNINKMYSLYSTWNKVKEYKCTKVYYREILKQMNVEFAKKVNCCEECQLHSTRWTSTNDMTYVEHIKNKKNAEELMQSDKELAEYKSPEVVCATFDLQTFSAPHGDVELFYYKRKLSMYNFTIMDSAERESHSYMWAEYTAKRGPNEIGSCLMHFMKSKVTEGTKSFLFWSDKSTGHNKVISLMYMLMAKQFNVNITHRFLVHGHTENEVHNIHDRIEKKAKDKFIYTPHEWYDFVGSTKSIEVCRNIVVEISQDDIFDFDSHVNERFWEKDNKNEDIIWENIKQISVRRNKPNNIYFKYDLKGKYRCLNTVKVRRGSESNVNEYEELKKLYSNNLAVPELKYKDLLSLCLADAIPSPYHDYFANLKHEADADDVEQS